MTSSPLRQGIYLIKSAVTNDLLTALPTSSSPSFITVDATPISTTESVFQVSVKNDGTISILSTFHSKYLSPLPFSSFVSGPSICYASTNHELSSRQLFLPQLAICNENVDQEAAQKSVFTLQLKDPSRPGSFLAMDPLTKALTILSTPPNNYDPYICRSGLPTNSSFSDRCYLNDNEDKPSDNSISPYCNFEFIQIPLPPGLYALQGVNGKILSTEKAGKGNVHANRGHIKAWEVFIVSFTSQGIAVFQSAISGHFITLDRKKGFAHATPLTPHPFIVKMCPHTLTHHTKRNKSDKDDYGELSFYEYLNIPSTDVNFSATINYNTTLFTIQSPLLLGCPYLLANFNKNAKKDGLLEIGGNTPPVWGEFRFLPLALPANRYYIRSLSNGKFLCAEHNKEKKPVAANRDVASTWEEFEVVNMIPKFGGQNHATWDHPTIAIKSIINDKYISARLGTKKSEDLVVLQACADKVLSWEHFLPQIHSITQKNGKIVYTASLCCFERPEKTLHLACDINIPTITTPIGSNVNPQTDYRVICDNNISITHHHQMNPLLFEFIPIQP